MVGRNFDKYNKQNKGKASMKKRRIKKKKLCCCATKNAVDQFIKLKMS